ncbi:sodium:calcium antiporter [Rhodococcus sp. X156]|uniref:sodium:calcium antiporter n=1 Tax=Rhodococcus sp. X156 TaxID=2499145 RepID=UPI000FD9F3C6|nr:sodium:calcium antiporter [Rhodococcus sp. X156]
MTHVLSLVGCILVIYLASEWFVNAVEWLGARLRMGGLAVGTVLAAVGTALPESVVTLVAVLLGSDEHGADIGMGAAIGGPLVVGTVAYAVAGVVLLARARGAHLPVLVGAGPGPARLAARDDRAPATDLAATTPRLARDQGWFLAIYAVKLGLGLVVFAYKPWLGLLFFAAYAVYVSREVRSSRGAAASTTGLAPLKLQPRRASPSTAAVLTQTVVTLALVFGASQLFVHELEWAGPALGVPATVSALLLAPLATELPEIMNAVVWCRQGKPQLALANLSGSMMIQVTVPSGLGLLFTSWQLDAPLVLAGVCTMASVGYLLVLTRTGRLTAGRLAGAAAFYGAFAVGLLALA